MSRGGVQKEDAVERLREALAAWVLREVSRHAESEPDSPVRSDVVAAVQDAVAAAIDAKIQAFSDARSALIAEELRQEVLGAFETLDGVFQARLDAMEEVWREAAEKHLAAAETSIQKAVLDRYEPRLNKLVADHARRLEGALRKAAADVQQGRPVNPEPTLDAPPSPAEEDRAAGDSPGNAPPGAVEAWRTALFRPRPKWMTTGMVVLAIMLIGGLVWRCAPWPAAPQAKSEAEASTDAREDAAEELRRQTAAADAQRSDGTVADEAGSTPGDGDAASEQDGVAGAADRPLAATGTTP